MARLVSTSAHPTKALLAARRWTKSTPAIQHCSWTRPVHSWSTDNASAEAAPSGLFLNAHGWQTMHLQRQLAQDGVTSPSLLRRPPHSSLEWRIVQIAHLKMSIDYDMTPLLACTACYSKGVRVYQITQHCESEGSPCIGALHNSRRLPMS